MDGKQHCCCKPGERIKEFKSEHEDWAEDRKWNLKCEGIKVGEMCVSFTLGFCFLGHWGSQGSNDILLIFLADVSGVSLKVKISRSKICNTVLILNVL